jgi:type III secretory pathway component EscV
MHVPEVANGLTLNDISCKITESFCEASKLVVVIQANLEEFFGVFSEYSCDLAMDNKYCHLVGELQKRINLHPSLCTSLNRGVLLIIRRALREEFRY